MQSDPMMTTDTATGLSGLPEPASALLNPAFLLGLDPRAAWMVRVLAQPASSYTYMPPGPQAVGTQHLFCLPNPQPDNVLMWRKSIYLTCTRSHSGRGCLRFIRKIKARHDLRAQYDPVPELMLDTPRTQIDLYDDPTQVPALLLSLYGQAIGPQAVQRLAALDALVVCIGQEAGVPPSSLVRLIWSLQPGRPEARVEWCAAEDTSWSPIPGISPRVDIDIPSWLEGARQWNTKGALGQWISPSSTLARIPGTAHGHLLALRRIQQPDMSAFWPWHPRDLT